MVSNKGNNSAKNGRSLQCPVCHQPLSFRIAKGRKSGKAFLMVVCLQDGRHFRGFVADRVYVKHLLDRVEENKHK